MAAQVAQHPLQQGLGPGSDAEGAQRGERLRRRRARKLAVGCSITLSILFGLAVLSGVIALVLPRFITSVAGVSSALPTYAEQGNAWLERYFASNASNSTASLTMIQHSSHLQSTKFLPW